MAGTLHGRRFVAPLLAAFLTAGACGGGGDGDGGGGGGGTDRGPSEGLSATIEDDPSVAPTPGGTLRYGIEAEVDGLNPTASALSAPGLVMANAVFDTLAVWSTEGEAVPYLAESFTPNDDHTEWTMRLRPGVKFHDGSDLNADAVIKAFETQRSDLLVGLAVRPFHPNEGAIAKVDDLTVTYTLLEPNAYFPGALTGQLGMVPSPAWLDAALDEPTLDQQPVGTGPFRFDQRSPDSITRFVRNDAWWNGEVHLDAVEFVPVSDGDVRVDLLINGELDGLHTTSAPNIERLVAAPGLKNELSDRSEEAFAMMNTAKPPFDDIRARQALTYATPLQNFHDLIGVGVLRRADQIFTPESPYYNPDVTQEGDQPDEAAPLVESYCADNPAQCSDGKIDVEFQFAGPSVEQTRIADVLNQGWDDFFNVTFQELPQDQLIQETATGSYNVVAWRQFGAVDPAFDNVWLLCRTVGVVSLNWPRLCDESRDQLLLEAQATTDAGERAQLYQQLAQKLHDDYIYIFLTHTLWANSFSSDVFGVCGHTTPEGVEMMCAVEGRTWHSNVWLRR